MLLAKKISAAVLLFIILITPAYTYPAENQSSWQGVINADSINIRSDSTVSSKIICKINKGDLVEVVQELYEWYKIRLPKRAPSFIHKNLVLLLGEGTARVLKNNVNIRLSADESSWILGKVNKNEVINIVGESGDWYKIEPVNNSFGWINKRFVDKYAGINKVEDRQVSAQIKKKDKIIKADKADENIFRGIIKPYGRVFRREATHKLISENNQVFFLKGTKASLDSLIYRKVEVLGKIINPNVQKYPIIEVIKIEVLD
ncbi:MAG: SH3 domain-containing protein [Candidatus Omnitrophota bacterium]